MAKKVGIEIVVDSKGAVKSFDNLGDAGSRAGKNISSESSKATNSIQGLNIKSIAATGAIIGLSAAVVKLSKSFVDLGIESFKNSERVETQFKTLLGSADSAKERYAELAKFAASTPFNLNEVANASKILQTLTSGALASGTAFRTVGDAAAIAGVRFDELAVTVGRAYSGLQSNRPIGEALARLQELGIVTGDVRTEIEELQKQARGKEAWEVLQKQLDKTNGGMEELSQTLEGKTSTLIDNLGLLSSAILESSGATDTFKKAIGTTSDFISNQLVKIDAQKARLKDINELTLTEAELLLNVNQNQLKANKDAERYNRITETQAKLLATGAFTIEQTEAARDKENKRLLESIYAIRDRLKVLKEEKKEEEERIRIEKEKDQSDKEAQKKAEERKKAQDEFNEALRVFNNEQKVKIELLREEQKVRVDSDIIDQNKEEEEERQRIAEQREVKAKKSIEDFKRARLSQDRLEKRLEKEKQKRFFETTDAGITAAKELFGENKLFTLAEIGLNTARGITSALALTPPNIPLASFIGITGAAQLAKASSQKYANGGFVEGSGTGRSDSISAQLSNGEFVVNARDTARNRDALENINNGGQVTPNINITVNAGVGTDGNEVAQLIVNELSRAQTLGLEPTII